MCTPWLAACWFHRPWVRLKLLRNQSRDQYFPRLHRVTRGAHTVGTSMLCLWGCGSRGCISLDIPNFHMYNSSCLEMHTKGPPSVSDRVKKSCFHTNIKVQKILRPDHWPQMSVDYLCVHTTWLCVKRICGRRPRDPWAHQQWVVVEMLRIDKSIQSTRGRWTSDPSSSLKKSLIYKYDIPVGFPPGITSREDCR